MVGSRCRYLVILEQVEWQLLVALFQRELAQLLWGSYTKSWGLFERIGPLSVVVWGVI